MMNRHVAKVAVAALAGTVTLMSSPAGASAQARGREAGGVASPGTAASGGTSAKLSSVSCSSAGNCVAGGQYYTSSGRAQALVVSEAGGVWGRGEEVPGTGALNTSGAAEVLSVSCVSAGNCSAGGYYTGDTHAPGDQQAFVVSEVRGVWGQAEEVPGLAALNTGYGADVGSVSCGAAGDCSAGGTYDDSSLREHAFVVREAGGVWGKAGPIPGATAPRYQMAEPLSLSCASAGNCSTGGQFGGPTAAQAFVASQVSGVWGQAEQVPGSGALNTGHLAQVTAVSCGSAGNCSAGGYYTDSAHAYQAFVISQVNGVWGQAEEIHGPA